MLMNEPFQINKLALPETAGLPEVVKIRKRRRAGFSLVEISLALAVIAFAFVAILGLLAPGIGNFTTALNTQTSAEIFQRVAADLQETDLDNILDSKVASGGGGQFVRLPFRYFDVQGQEVRLSGTSEIPSEEEKKRIIYTVRVRVSNVGDPNPDNHSANNFNSLPGIKAPRFNPRDMVFISIQVADTKGREIESLVDPSTFLIKPEKASKAGVPMRTYSILVARNGYQTLKK